MWITQKNRPVKFSLYTAKLTVISVLGSVVADPLHLVEGSTTSTYI